MENALYVVWSEEDATGISIIDEQHRSMVSIINTLYYFINKNKGDEFLKQTMKMVEQLAILHFATEEELMQQTGFEEYEAHKKAHQCLLEGAREILYEEATPEDAVAALRFLRQWWRKHMNGEDKKFIEHYKKHTKFTKAWNTV